MFQEGLLVVISGPSGAGKGTVCKTLVQSREHMTFSVSATTRQAREGEIEGKSYFFKTKEQFQDMIKHNELIEWDAYCDNYYGTPKKYVDEKIKAGFDIILEITVEGALNIKKQYPESVLIFILPPSFEELRRRIVGRGTEKADVIEKRLEKAKNEIQFISQYDYVVINDHIEKAASFISSIITSEKLKYNRNTGILSELGM